MFRWGKFNSTPDLHLIHASFPINLPGSPSVTLDAPTKILLRRWRCRSSSSVTSRKKCRKLLRCTGTTGRVGGRVAGPVGSSDIFQRQAENIQAPIQWYINHIHFITGNIN